MTKKNQPKKAHEDLDDKIAKDIVAIRNLKTLSEEKKEELIKELLAKKSNSGKKRADEKIDIVPPYALLKKYADVLVKFALRGGE